MSSSRLALAIQDNERNPNELNLVKTETISSQQNQDSKDYLSTLKELRKNGCKIRSDRYQPDLSTKPSWFRQDLFENAKSIYSRHFMGINFAHLSGLLLLVRVNSIFRTLSRTGKSDSVSKLFVRYYHTVIHVKKWYEGDIFEMNSEAQRSLMIVRGMHNKVSSSLNGCAKKDVSIAEPIELNNNSNSNNSNNNNSQGTTSDEEEALIVRDKSITKPADEAQGVHISQYDIMITQFAFIGFIVTKPKCMGLLDDFNQKDLESLLHFWRVIGFYLGASDEYNLCSYEHDDMLGLCKAMIELEYKDSIAKNQMDSTPGIMSLNIVRSVKFIPMLTIYGIMRYLYETLEIETTELRDRETRFTRLSYNLIKLVMSSLLAYRPLRAFNNGLTRLSVYMVGKVENWFTSHLESKYGQQLRF